MRLSDFVGAKVVDLQVLRKKNWEGNGEEGKREKKNRRKNLNCSEIYGENKEK